MGKRIMGINVQSLAGQFVVVDLETGTVLGTDLVIVPADKIDSDASDSEIVEEAKKYSLPLYADLHVFH